MTNHPPTRTDHSIPIRDALRHAASPLSDDVLLPDAVQMTAAEAVAAADMLAAMRLSGELLVMLRDLKDAAGKAEASIRSALQRALEESGAGSIRLGRHVLTLVEPSPGPFVSDPASLPAEFLVPRDPAPDLAAIKRALRDRQTIPGVSIRNGQPHLRLVAQRA